MSDLEINNSAAAEQARQAVLQQALIEEADYISENWRDDITNGCITLGMTPYEAKLAGGAFTYEVNPDKSVWEKNADPIKVMWTQSIVPDSSEIRMSFRNHNQFPQLGMISFEVVFEKGVVVRIIKAS